MAQILRNKDVRRITFVIPHDHSFPGVFTFREKLSYNEDKIYRYVEPPLAYTLELRLAKKKN